MKLKYIFFLMACMPTFLRASYTNRAMAFVGEEVLTLRDFRIYALIKSQSYFKSIQNLTFNKKNQPVLFDEFLKAHQIRLENKLFSHVELTQNELVKSLDKYFKSFSSEIVDFMQFDKSDIKKSVESYLLQKKVNQLKGSQEWEKTLGDRYPLKFFKQ